MTDPRVERLARLVVDYSLELKPGALLRIDGAEEAAPLMRTLHRHALEAGAHPYLKVDLDGLGESFAARATDEQLSHIPPFRWTEIEDLNAQVTIWAERNTRSFSGIDPARHSASLEGQAPLTARRRERFALGELAWCGLIYPTHAYAQDAAMTLDHYERFLYRACHVEDDGDPVAYWRGVSRSLRTRAERLAGYRSLRILGPDTDLTLSVGGRAWLVGDGRVNLPDGECYTSPLESETNGEIWFQLPVIEFGREMTDVRLRFSDGEIVHAEARGGNRYLRSLLEVEGARVLGEIGIGLNYEIDCFTANVGLDEKIGGTIHLAIGNGYAAAGGRNRSAVHVDMVCDLRSEGEIHADGELVWSSGRFLDDSKGAR